MIARKGMLPRSFWYSLGVYVVFNSLFLALVIIKPGTPRQFEIMDDVGQGLAGGNTPLSCWPAIDLQESIFTR